MSDILDPLEWESLMHEWRCGATIQDSMRARGRLRVHDAALRAMAQQAAPEPAPTADPYARIGRPGPCETMEYCEGAGGCQAPVGRCTSYEGRRKAERAAAASPETAARLGACRTCGNLNIPADGRCRNCGEMRR